MHLSHDAAGDGIYGSAVFKINKSSKVPFSNQIDRLDQSQFEAFRLLFTAIESALAPTENAAAGDLRS